MKVLRKKLIIIYGNKMMKKRRREKIKTMNETTIEKKFFWRKK